MQPISHLNNYKDIDYSSFKMSISLSQCHATLKSLSLSLFWIRQYVCHCLHTDYLQQEIGSSDVASVSVTRWRAVRMGSELSLPVPTSLPSTKPLADLVICCEIKAKHGMSKSWRTHLPGASDRTDFQFFLIE